MDSTDPSLGETLVNDIESFIQKANTRDRNEKNDVSLSSSPLYIMDKKPSLDFIRNFKDDRSETISETSTIKEDEELSEEGSDDEDEVVHVECSVKAEPTEHQLVLVKSNDGSFLEAAVQEHQMSNIQENHSITILKLRVLGELLFTKIVCSSLIRNVGVVLI